MMGLESNDNNKENTKLYFDPIERKNNLSSAGVVTHEMLDLSSLNHLAVSREG